MLLLIAVGKVETRHIHTILSKFHHDVPVIGIGAHGTDNLGLLHFKSSINVVQCDM